MVGGFGHLRFRKGLVVTQVALSLVLLIGAGLFTRSLYNVKNIDVGMRTDHLIQFTIQPSLNGYSQQRMLALFERLRDDISKFPGVRAVSMAEEPVLAAMWRPERSGWRVITLKKTKTSSYPRTTWVPGTLQPWAFPF